MAANLTELTRRWIQFLKNNRIAKGSPDPSGRVAYIRKPRVQELIKFLRISGDYDDKQINASIKQVLNASNNTTQQQEPDQKAIGGQKALRAPTSTQVAQPEPQQSHQPRPQQKKYDNNDVEDVNFREPGHNDPLALQHKRKPRFKYRNKVSEAFYDDAGYELDEDDVVAVFKILTTPAPTEKPPEEKEKDPNEIKSREQEYMRQMKQIVRDVMTPQQRKALWRALSEA